MIGGDRTIGRTRWRWMGVKLSARNVLDGTVSEIEDGAVNAVVKVDIGGGRVISSVITLDALRDMGLKVGDKVSAIIKSSNEILGKD